MEFRFNFFGDEPQDKKEDVEATLLSWKNDVLTFTLSEFIQTQSLQKCLFNEVVLASGCVISHAIAPECDIACKKFGNSDLVTGLYEGGLKVWECSLDLANYLIETRINFKNKVVFEIGCGVGLPGIVAAKKHPKLLLFQDFNEFVLRHCTVQTAVNNLTNEDISHNNVRFICGDWNDVRIKEKADVILMSETIYECRNFSRLHSLIDRSLAPDGVVYLASKAFYFGVGGGVQQWSSFVDVKKTFSIRLVKLVNAPLRREVWVMKRTYVTD